jgi:hypothetical protein
LGVKGGVMVNKRWADFSDGQKVAIVFLGTIQVGLLAAALWDLAHRSADEIRGSRRMWAVLVFINWIGPLAYFSIGRKRECRCPSWCESWCESWCKSRCAPSAD